MIVTCPTCRQQYQVEDAAPPPTTAAPLDA